MVAVFHYTLRQASSVQFARKVISFEQQDGVWKIIRENALPSNSKAAQSLKSDHASPDRVSGIDPLSAEVNLVGLNLPVYNLEVPQ